MILLTFKEVIWTTVWAGFGPFGTLFVPWVLVLFACPIKSGSLLYMQS